MSNLKKTSETPTSSTYLPQLGTVQQSIVSVFEGPLLIPMQEIGQTDLFTKTTKAEIYIQSLSSSQRVTSEYKLSKLIGHDGMNNAGNKNSDAIDGDNNAQRDADARKDDIIEDIDRRMLEEENNPKQTLQKIYSCNICDDVCADELDFKNHLEFHLELHSTQDTDGVELDNTISLEEPDGSIINSPIASAVADESNNDSMQILTIDVDNSSKPVDDPKNNQTVTVKSEDSKLAKQKTALAVRKRVLEELQLTSNKLPNLPIRPCDCHLKKLDTKCKLCRKPATYICGNCKKEFASYTKLKNHFTVAHKRVNWFCQECGRGYTGKTNLIKHMNRHKGHFDCNQCYKSFAKKYNLDKHIITHRVQCDKICLSKTELKTHKLKIHEGVVFHCDQCKSTFSKKCSLKYHKLKVHRTSGFQCQQCGEKYTTLTAIKTHREQHKRKKPVICEECGKELSSAKGLKQHKTQVHRKDPVLKKKYECKICKKEFITCHARNSCQDKHEGNARHKCNLCEKAYFYAASLMIHKRLHTGEKPYICFVCSRRFYTSQILFKHCLSHRIPEKDVILRLRTSYQPEIAK